MMRLADLAGWASAADIGLPEASARAAFTEDDFFALRARLEDLRPEELARFRAAPENQVILQQFDAFARRQARPYLCALTLMLVVSISAGMLVG